MCLRCNKEAYLLLGCVAFFAVPNYCLTFLVRPTAPTTPPNPATVFVIYACYGAIGSQVGLHAIWCAFAPVPWINRLFVGIASALALFGAWVLGFTIYALRFPLMSHTDWWHVVIVLFSLPLLWVAVQFPHWGMRVWFRWRIAHQDDESPATFATLGIRDLLVATAVIAVALIPAQISQSWRYFFLPLLIFALVYLGLSAITTLPLLVATLRARRVPIALALVLTLAVAVTVGYGMLIVVAGGPAVTWKTLVTTSSITSSFFICLTVPLLIARRLGYRLLWGRGEPSSTSVSD